MFLPIFFLGVVTYDGMVTRDPKRGQLQPMRMINGPPTQQFFIKDREGKVVSSLAVNICPFLGSRLDPATARSFVTPENCCYRVNPATTVKGEHQRVSCLTSNYSRCRIFRHPTEIKLPPKRLRKKRHMGIVLPTLLVCLLLVFFTAVVLATITW